MANEKVQVSQGELERLLREAERAHGEYETTLGHRDENWPEWYAKYIVGKLNETAAEASAGHSAQEQTGGTPTA